MTNDLESHLADLRKITKLSYLQYSKLAGFAFQIEVKKADLKKVPHDWIKLSQTKALARFRSPEVMRLANELEKCKEQLEIECDAAFKTFLGRIVGDNNYEIYRMVVQAVAQLDCLMSLAAVSSQPHYVQAQYVDEPCIDISHGRHPMVEQHLLDGYVPNDTDLNSQSTRALILTGPNMGGKSSYVRQVALIAIMAQVGSYVPAESARLGILDAVYTRMGAYDNIMSGESTFKVELKECGDIMKHASERSLVILDEIGRGTGTMDGVAIAYAVLAYFVEDVKALTLFVTHYPSLAEFESKFPGIVKNYHMGFLESSNGHSDEDDQDGSPDLSHKTITFLYTLVAGIAHRSYGLNVARLARLPESVITEAGIMSQRLEAEVQEREDEKVLKMVAKMIDKISNGQGTQTEMDNEEMEKMKLVFEEFDRH